MDIPGTPSAAAPDPVVKQEVDDEDVKPDVKKLQEELKKQQAAAAAQKMFWLYRGRHQGWWRFDPRIEKEIEEAFTHQMPMTEVTICGNPYIVDFSQMCQYPKNQSNYSRNVKRVNSTDFDSLNVKGMSGVFVATTSPPAAAN